MKLSCPSDPQIETSKRTHTQIYMKHEREDLLQPATKKKKLPTVTIHQSRAVMPEFRSQMYREEEDMACEFRYKIGLLVKE